MKPAPQTVPGYPHLVIRRVGMVGQGTVLIATCPGCNEEYVITVPTLGMKAWIAGALIQVALPELDDTEREHLITGYCEACWDKMMPEEEEEPPTFFTNTYMNTHTHGAPTEVNVFFSEGGGVSVALLTGPAEYTLFCESIEEVASIRDQLSDALTKGESNDQADDEKPEGAEG